MEQFPGFVRLRRYLASDDHRATHQKLDPQVRARIGKPRVEVHEVLEVSP